MTDSVLAFDTSSDVLTAAVKTRRMSIVSKKIRARGQHSQKLFGHIEMLMKKAKQPFSALTALAVGIGPGSFGGLRVGVMAAKTMAFTLKIPVVGLSTLRVIAENCRSQTRPVAVVLKAGRGFFYYAVYKEDQVKHPPELIRREDFFESPDPLLCYTGNGLEEAGPVLKQRWGRKAVLMEASQWAPDARLMISLAETALQQRRYQDPTELLPDYLFGRDCNIKVPNGKTSQ